MGYDKNTKLITLDKVVIGGEEFLMTSKEREDLEKERLEREKRQKEEIESLPDVYKIDLNRLREMYENSTIW